MASVRVQCHKCGRNTSMPAEAAGQSFKCPGCGVSLRVPPSAGDHVRPKRSTGGRWRWLDTCGTLAMIAAIVGVIAGFVVLWKSSIGLGVEIIAQCVGLFLLGGVSAAVSDMADRS